MNDRHDRQGGGDRTNGRRPAAGNHDDRTPLPPGRRRRPPAPPDRYRYSMSELEAETGLVQRTIRYYITRGLLPPAHGRGPTATYDQSHLLRLKAIQLRRGRNEPLEAIKDELAHLTDDEIAHELKIQTEPPEDRWRRIILHPDIELHVRDRGGERDPSLDRAVDLILRFAYPVIDDLERSQ